MTLFGHRKFIAPPADRRAMPEGLWMKCAGCGEAVFRPDVEKNLHVCPLCRHHHRIGARLRIECTADPGSFEETHAQLVSGDPLEFEANGESYPARLERARRSSGLPCALVTGWARIEGARVVLGAVDARFIMGSMGGALGEKFCRAAEDAAAARTPFVCFAASGGARMHEGTVALMQMAKTAGAVRMLNETATPYISVLTDPTTGGVFASFASQGDVVAAEPRAYIGFAGARLIEGALGVALPEGFQRAEYQRAHGFVDEVVDRHAMRPYLGRLARLLEPES